MKYKTSFSQEASTKEEAEKVFSQIEEAVHELVFFETCTQNGHSARYSILAFGENERFDIKTKEDYLLFKNRTLELKTEKDKTLPPMVGSFFGYFSYSIITFFENVEIDLSKDEIPLGIFILPKYMIIFDMLEQKIFYITISGDTIKNPKLDIFLYKNKTEIIEQKCLLQKQKHNILGKDIFSIQTKQDYIECVKKCQEFIKAGDAFQIVPSIGFECQFSGEPFSFYLNLKKINPSSFMFFVRFSAFCLIGASPEILVSVDERKKVTIKPLAGTRKRGATKEEDEILKQDLLADKKELAEHLMLVDLGRNDVGKVATNVKVKKMMEVEFYSHVMHISSTVEGDLMPSKNVFDALESGLPAGTLSGAPKVRAMQILSQLEPENRVFYSGLVGYISSEILETCISIRCAIIKNGILKTKSGAGVVFDSNPEAEYQECINKSTAIFRSLNN